MRGGQLTDRMPHQHIRSHTPRLHQPEQRHLQREQPRLGIDSPLQQPRILTEHHPTQRQLKIHPRTHRVKSIREHRERTVQLPAHTQPLRTLPREQQRRGTLTCCSPDGPGGRLVRRQCRQAVGVARGVLGEHDGAVCQSEARRGERPARRDGGDARVLTERDEPLRPCVQGRSGVGREGPGQYGALGRCRGQGDIGLFQDDMGVGAADSERGDGCPARPAGPWRPRRGLGEETEAAGVPVDGR